MAKDPAFLFYSGDYYSGTRLMSPEERACYLDLLILQHQKGIIPNDIRRLVGHCVGCSEQTVKYVLNEKFEQTSNGWLNQKLNHVMNERAENLPKKCAAACFAGLISKRKLSANQRKMMKSAFNINTHIYHEKVLIKDEEAIKKSVRQWFQSMFNQMVNNIEDENEIEDEDLKDKKGAQKNSVEIYPTFDQFWDAYQKKTDRKKAQEKWNKLSQRDKELVMNHVPLYVQSTPDAQFRKDAKTYLNNESWKNEIIQNANTKTSKQSSSREFTRQAQSSHYYQQS